MKPVVHYREVAPGFIHIGVSATIIPLNHGSSLVVNGEIAHTSRVISYDAQTGDFETMNTKYVRAE